MRHPTQAQVHFNTWSLVDVTVLEAGLGAFRRCGLTEESMSLGLGFESLRLLVPCCSLFLLVIQDVNPQLPVA